jgi:lysophospholipase L1-like esterase
MLRDYFSLAWLVVLAAGSVAGAERGAMASTDPLPVQIAATDAKIRLVGRFDTQDSAGPRCQWSASRIELWFRGTDLNAKINESGHDYLEAVVDGKPEALKLDGGEQIYRIASGLPDRVHIVALMKRTEPFVGTTQFTGFQLNAGGSLLSPPTRPAHRIEVIGDSISCGYGNEGKNQNEHFANETENAFLSYGAVAARRLHADYQCIAWSGRKMWPDNTIPDIYDLILPNGGKTDWDFSKWKPDVVLINLATNDFGRENPPQQGWTDAYKAFIARLRKHYPQAQIYCAIGSMMSDGYPPGHKALSTVRAYLTQVVADENQAGDNKVHLLEFAMQDAANGFGSDWHPNVKTHQVMADKLVETLQHDLGWKPAATARKRTEGRQNRPVL